MKATERSGLRAFPEGIQNPFVGGMREVRTSEHTGPILAGAMGLKL